jgi:hypothetical protein
MRYYFRALRNRKHVHGKLLTFPNGLPYSTPVRVSGAGNRSVIGAIPIVTSKRDGVFILELRC